MAQTDVAAVLGALGAIGVLAFGRRLFLLGGLVLLAVGEILLAHEGGLHLSVKVVAAGIVGVIALTALAAVLLRARWLVIPLVAVAAPFRLPLDFGRSHKYFIAVAHGGQLGRYLPLYVVLAVATMALVLDTATDKVVGSVEAGDRPWGIGLAPDEKTLYTANGPSDDVSVIDVASRMVTKKIPVGHGPWGLAVVQAP